MIELSVALAGIVVPRGEFHITAEQTKLLATADTYVKLTGFSGSLLQDFTVTDDKMTYTGSRTRVFKVNGVADISVNKACTLSFALYLNGSIVAHEVTPHTFLASSKVANISIVALAELETNDYIEIWAKSSAINTTVTSKKLDVVLTTTIGA